MLILYILYINISKKKNNSRSKNVKKIKKEVLQKDVSKYSDTIMNNYRKKYNKDTINYSHNILNDYKKNDMKLSVVIPFIMRDIKFLKSTIRKLNKQTVKPFEIIVSGEIDYSNNIIKKLNNKNNINKYKIVLKNNGKKPPGINRNKGALVSKGDIITFMDVDDDYHPQRNEIILKSFKNNKDMLFLGHAFIFGKKPNFKNYKEKDLDYSNTKDVYKSTFGINKYNSDWESLRSSKSWIANGHVSVKKDVVKDMKYLYNDWTFGEDSKYNSVLLKDFKDTNKIIILNNPLSGYVPNSQQHKLI